MAMCSWEKGSILLIEVPGQLLYTFGDRTIRLCMFVYHAAQWLHSCGMTWDFSSSSQRCLSCWWGHPTQSAGRIKTFFSLNTLRIEMDVCARLPYISIDGHNDLRRDASSVTSSTTAIPTL